ncbi:MAG TPA: hypothetical protein ENG63_02345 [Candidatus Desulfofervidus auxilii]|uniref:Uncharacterized protein n=1 Tax=Desulfofervidus auxilii TaxID=1621989 RepID=A0A7C0Y4J9_DESA2|nr:hypothetical protein [Candidatus Desulfofervidus auxilii]
MDYYLNIFPIISDKEQLNQIGWWKLTRIRKTTINHRHILQTLFTTSKDFELHQKYAKEFFNKFFANWKLFNNSFERFILYNILKALKASHKQNRKGNGTILQIFDFDKTITNFKKCTNPNDAESILRLINKGIEPLKINGKNSSFQINPFELKVKRIIVSASGDSNSIINYLTKHNQLHYFDKIYALGGDKYKAHFLFNIRDKKNYDLIFYYDDDPLFHYGVLTLFFISYKVNKFQINKIVLK